MRPSIVHSLLAAAILLTLTGCATQAQKQIEQMERQFKDASDQNAVCQAKLEKDDASGMASLVRTRTFSSVICGPVTMRNSLDKNGRF